MPSLRVLTHHGISLFCCLLQLLPDMMADAYNDYEYHDNDRPYFLPRPTNVSFNRGDTAVLICGIGNLGTKTVIWRRASDPNPLTIGQDVYVGDTRYSAKEYEDKQEWHLIIKDVKSADAGVYECQVSSRMKLIHHILLRVNSTARPERKNYDSFKQDQEEPVVTQKNPGESTHSIFVSGTSFVEKGDTIHLVCNSTGRPDPPDNLDWFKDGIKLTPDGIRQIKIDKFHIRATRTLVSTLKIQHSRMEDAGTYVCRSSELAITSTKVHVLNAGSTNVRRGTSATDTAETKLSGNQGNSQSAHGQEGSHNGGHCTQSSLHNALVLLVLLVTFLNSDRTLR